MSRLIYSIFFYLVDLLASAKDDTSRCTSLISDMDNLEKTIVAVQEMLERVTDYVNKVLVSLGHANHIFLRKKWILNFLQ
jgi:hypothetical protein